MINTIKSIAVRYYASKAADCSLAIIEIESEIKSLEDRHSSYGKALGIDLNEAHADYAEALAKIARFSK